MATFEQTRSMRNQQHFEVLEIDLPVITGACTIGSSPGYGTPRTCDQAWSGEYKTYKFTNQNAPLIKGSLSLPNEVAEFTETDWQDFEDFTLEQPFFIKEQEDEPQSAYICFDAKHDIAAHPQTRKLNTVKLTFNAYNGL